MKEKDQHRNRYLVLGRDKSYRFLPNKFHRNLYQQNARVFDWKHICNIWCTRFPTENLNHDKIYFLEVGTAFIRDEHTKFDIYVLITKSIM